MLSIHFASFTPFISLSTDKFCLWNKQQNFENLMIYDKKLSKINDKWLEKLENFDKNWAMIRNVWKMAAAILLKLLSR